MKKYFALLLAFGLLVGCSTPKEEKSETSVVENEGEKEKEKEEEKEIATSGKYVVTNTTGETVTELYIYKTGSEDKGENYAADGLADGEGVTIEVTVDKADAEGYAQTLEYVTESGRSENSFQSLHLEEAKMNLLPADVDAYTSATPFEWAY